VQLYAGSSSFKTKCQLIFGCQLKLELPVAVTNIAGNAEVGSQIIANRKQLHNHNEADVKIDIANAKNNIIKNYQYIREKGPSLSLTTIGEGKTYPKQQFLTGDMIKTGDSLRLAGSLREPMDLRKSISVSYFMFPETSV